MNTINFPYINGTEIPVSENCLYLNSSWVHPIKDDKWDTHFVWELDVIQKFVDQIQDNFVILAGSTYSKDLIPNMKNYELPLKGKRIGEQKSWLKKQLEKIKETVIKLTHLLYEAIKGKSPRFN